MRFYGYAFVLIVNRDAKPIKEADQPPHLTWYGSWQALEFCNRYGRFPAEAINLHAEDMQVGLESPDRGADVYEITTVPREPKILGPGSLQDTIRRGAVHADSQVGRTVTHGQGDRQIDTPDTLAIPAVLERERGLAHPAHPGPRGCLSSATA